MLACALVAQGCGSKKIVQSSSTPQQPSPQIPSVLQPLPVAVANKKHWTLGELYTVADGQNSSLLTFRQQIGAAKGRLREAANPPNPDLLIGDSSVASGPRGAFRGKRVGVGQEILLPGKLSKAKQVQQEALSATEYDFQVQRTMVHESIRRVVINLRANLLFEEVQWEYLAAVDQALASAKAQSDLDRLEIETKVLLLDITALAVENSLLGHELESLLGFTQFGQISATSVPQLIDEQINSEALARLDLIDPSVLLPLRSRAHRVEQQQASYSLAKSNVYANPSVESAFGQNDMNGDSEVSLGLRIPIPLFARQQGNLQEAKALVELQTEQYRSDERELRREIRDLQQRANELDTFIVEYNENVIPWAESSFNQVLADYKSGTTTIHDYLSALQRSVSVKKTLITYKRDLSLVQSRVTTFLDFVSEEYFPVVELNGE